MKLLIDPHLAGEAGAVTAELAATEEVIARLFMFLDANNRTAIGGLQELAKATDSLRRLVGLDPMWTERTKSSPAPIAGDDRKVGGAQAPAASSPVPPEHVPHETRKFIEKVHIMDTNYFDEYLGYIELIFEARKVASGQVYINYASATSRLLGKGDQYLNVASNVVAQSVMMNGEHFSDIFFDVQIGGPNLTETSSFSAGLKFSESNGDKGGEVSLGMGSSNAVSSQASRSFRRVFRVIGIEKPVQIMVPQASPPYAQTPESVGMILKERSEFRYDFEEFELDDDDVGDTLTSLNANWILHSYSD